MYTIYVPVITYNNNNILRNTKWKTKWGEWQIHFIYEQVGMFNKSTMSRDCINNKYIQSARVYLKLGRPAELIIKCCLCDIDGFTDWVLFLKHVRSSHVAGQWKGQCASILDMEIQAEVELEMQNLKNINSEYERSDVEAESDDSNLDEVDLNMQLETEVNDVLTVKEPAQVGEWN